MDRPGRETRQNGVSPRLWHWPGEGQPLRVLDDAQPDHRKERLLRLNDWSLGHQLTQAAGTDIFFIPQEHYPQAEPENGESGWWYRVREVAQCRQCMVCCRRKLRAEFTGEDWNKQRPVKCSQCKGDGQRSTSRGQDRRKHKRARRDSQGGRDKGCHQSMVQDGEPTRGNRQKRDGRHGGEICYEKIWAIGRIRSRRRIFRTKSGTCTKCKRVP